MTAAPAPADAATQFSHRQILTILSGLMAGMFLAALDQTIVATSIRTIADDLQGLSLQAWATTAYLITATVSTPLYGKLSDLYGRRPFFLTAITVFVVGSALCGLAESMWQLAAFRAVQGLGAGGLFSLALTIIGDIVPPRERAKYQGYFLAVFGTSSVLGPVVGGFLAGQDTLLGVTGWRWVFLVNVPVGAAALLLVVRSLHLPHQRRDHRIDWPGALALVAGLVPLLLLAEQGRDWGWASARSLTAMVVGAVGIVGFVLAERAYGDDALLPLRLFRGRTFGVGSLLNFLLGMGMFGGLAALPLYLQIVKGRTPTEAGLLLLPLTAGIMAGSVLAGQVISRTGRYKRFPVIGAVLLVIAMVLLSTVGVDTPLWVTLSIATLFGLGLGFNMQPLVLAVQNAVSPRDMGVATSSATFFRQMGGTLGTAVFLSVLFSTVGEKILAAFRADAADPAFRAALRDPQVLADPTNASVVESLRSGGRLPAGALDDTSFLSALDPRIARPFLEGFAGSMSLVFGVAAAVLLVGLLVVLFLPEEPLRSLSGIQAQQQEAAETAAAAAEVSAPSSQMVDGALLEEGRGHDDVEPAAAPRR
ncbi:MAG TPA: MDR family MFS transporter [Actinomycetes bacterium]|nr:MDR family MFS transporter [Actinomycetes bacterium]